MRINKSTIYSIDAGRVYFSKVSNAWFFVYEGTFLTAAANTGYRSDRAACEAARPQTRLTASQAADAVTTGRI